MNLLLGAVDISEVCTETQEILQIIGYVLLIFKIAIPLIIIALGSFDFGKAVIAEKEDEIKKQTKRLIYRVIAGIIIFLVPNIVMFLFGLIGGYNDAVSNGSGFETCKTCILEPYNCN